MVKIRNERYIKKRVSFRNNRENGKLILCLSNEDLHNLVDLKRLEEKPTAEVLSDMLNDMLINLEK